MYSSSLIENQVTALAFTEELNRIAEAHLPEIEKCSAFLSPAHAALVLGAPAVIGAAGGALRLLLEIGGCSHSVGGATF